MKKQARYSNFLILMSLTFAIAGCSMDASIQDIASKVAEVLQAKSTNNEFVPASQQRALTADGYKVQSSLSYHSSSSEVVTSSGYKVQTSVQSTLYKE